MQLLHTEQQKLQVECWQTRHHLLKTSVKVAHHRVIEMVGREKADEVFKDVIQVPENSTSR